VIRADRFPLRARRPAAALVLVSLASLVLACTQLKRCAYEGWGRDGWQQPDRVVETLALAPGARVADLGSGGGYFTFRLARAVGPTGRVYAVDVDASLNEYVSTRAREEGLANVEVILAGPADPKLPEEGVDLLFTSNTYHHLEDRSRYFGAVRERLRPHGRVAILEYAEGGFLHGSHATPRESIVAEMESAGFRVEQDHDFLLPRQHFLVFTVQ
jgi:predicted methyltransferase